MNVLLGDMQGFFHLVQYNSSIYFSVLIKSMKEVRMGRTTDVLRSKEIAWTYSEDCAFSIIYNDNFESLDLIASTPDEANIWVTGLNLLINATKCKIIFYDEFLYNVCIKRLSHICMMCIINESFESPFELIF